MADERKVSFGVEFDVDPSPLDETKKKEEEVREEAEKAAKAVKKIGTNLSDIGTRARTAFQETAGAGASMGTTIRGAMLQSIKSGGSLGTTIKTGIGAGFDNVKAKAQGFGASVKSVLGDIGKAVTHPAQSIKATLGGALEKVGTEAKDAGKKAKDAGSDLETMEKRGTAGANSLVTALKKIGLAAAVLTMLVAGVKAVGDFGNAAIAAAAQAEEAQSKFEVVFGGQAAGAQTWIDNFADAAKRSKQEVKSFMADAQALYKGIGMNEETAAGMSKQMTALAYDLASFHNIADADAFAKLRSGLMGETEGLKTMGIVLNETAIQQAMLSAGYKGNESALRKQFNAMDEGTKAQMRFNAILAQTKDAQTDVTRTSDSYTNSLKGIKGMWQDFLANAGAKFTPALTKMFNVILAAWPQIEPMLMQLVDVLADGLVQAVPILLQLGQTLLPIFVQALSMVLQVAQPLMPVLMQIAQTALPPLASIIALLAQTLLPPLINILDALNTSVLQPLMPVFLQLAQTLLPPIAQLLGYIAPVLQALSPVIAYVGQVLAAIAEVVGKIIGWAADGVGSVVDFFTALFGGAKQANEETDKLASSMADVTKSTDVYKPPEITPPAAIEMPPIQIDPLPAQTSIAQIDTAATDTYGAIADSSGQAWTAMGDQAKAGADRVISEFRRIGVAADGIGTIAVTATANGGTKIPHNAEGTNSFEGGFTYKDEEGGEIAYLPSGTTIIPADKSEQLISRSSRSSKVFAPVIQVTLGGKATEQDKQELETWFMTLARKAYEQNSDDDAVDDQLADALA